MSRDSISLAGIGLTLFLITRYYQKPAEELDQIIVARVLQSQGFSRLEAGGCISDELGVGGLGILSCYFQVCDRSRLTLCWRLQGGIVPDHSRVLFAHYLYNGRPQQLLTPILAAYMSSARGSIKIVPDN